MKHSAIQQRGVSLIEAVVAMAIMGFGMLGVLGMQSALRSNADISKQRSEAVRIAQAAIEARRSFSVLAATAGAIDYDAIATVLPANVAGDNATFSFTPTVTNFPAVGDELTVAPHKRLVVDVSWPDRNNEIQTVRMGTIISAMAPEVAAALATPGDGSPAQTPSGRNPTVPGGAVDLGNGTSRFTPPNAPTGVTWTFNNVNGFITHTCLFLVCTPFQGRLLAGFVNFATGSSQPTRANAELPPSGILGSPTDTVRVSVPISSPRTDTIPCFHQASSTYVAYYCAMPVTLIEPHHWTSDDPVVVALPSGYSLVDDIDDDDDDRYRVCRYTTTAARVLPHLVVPAIRNEDHPLRYAEVTTSLIGQNYLVIRAGDGSDAFTCPEDDTSTPEINGSTWHHDPRS